MFFPFKTEGSQSRTEGGRSKTEGGRSRTEGGRSKTEGGRSRTERGCARTEKKHIALAESVCTRLSRPYTEIGMRLKETVFA